MTIQQIELIDVINDLTEKDLENNDRSLGISNNNLSALSSNSILSRLSNLETSQGNNKGSFETSLQLITAYPTPTQGWFAYVIETTSQWQVNTSNEWYDTEQDIKDNFLNKNNNLSEIVNKDLARINLGANKYLSAGVFTQPNYIDNGDGSITIGTGEYNFYNDTLIEKHQIDGNTFTLNDNTTYYIVANYNNGNPSLEAITNSTLINYITIVKIYQVTRKGNVLYVISNDETGKNLIEKIQSRTDSLEPFKIKDGLLLSVIPNNRHFYISAGDVYYGNALNSLLAIDTNDDTVNFWYHTAGNWITNPLQVNLFNNTQYDSGLNLLPLSNNRYTVNWILRCVSNSKQVHLILGSGDYTLEEAQNSKIPDLPHCVAETSVLVGRIIIKKDDVATPIVEIISKYNFVMTNGSYDSPTQLNDIQRFVSPAGNDSYNGQINRKKKTWVNAGESFSGSGEVDLEAGTYSEVDVGFTYKSLGNTWNRKTIRGTLGSERTVFNKGIKLIENNGQFAIRNIKFDNSTDICIDIQTSYLNATYVGGQHVIDGINIGGTVTNPIWLKIGTNYGGSFITINNCDCGKKMIYLSDLPSGQIRTAYLLNTANSGLYAGTGWIVAMNKNSTNIIELSNNNNVFKGEFANALISSEIEYNAIVGLGASAYGFYLANYTKSNSISAVNATTNILTINSHGLKTGQPVYFTGSLPSPLIVNQSYIVYKIDNNNISLLDITTNLPIDITTTTSGGNCIAFNSGDLLYITSIPLIYNKKLSAENTFFNISDNECYTKSQGKWKKIASGGGHVIQDSSNSFTQRSNLKFTGGVGISDDSINDATIVNIQGGGGLTKTFTSAETLPKGTIVQVDKTTGKVKNIKETVSGVGDNIVDITAPFDISTYSSIAQRQPMSIIMNGKRVTAFKTTADGILVQASEIDGSQYGSAVHPAGSGTYPITTSYEVTDIIKISETKFVLIAYAAFGSSTNRMVVGNLNGLTITFSNDKTILGSGFLVGKGALLDSSVPTFAIFGASKSYGNTDGGVYHYTWRINADDSFQAIATQNSTFGGTLTDTQVIQVDENLSCWLIGVGGAYLGLYHNVQNRNVISSTTSLGAYANNTCAIVRLSDKRVLTLTFNSSSQILYANIYLLQRKGTGELTAGSTTIQNVQGFEWTGLQTGLNICGLDGIHANASISSFSEANRTISMNYSALQTTSGEFRVIQSAMPLALQGVFNLLSGIGTITWLSAKKVGGNYVQLFYTTNTVGDTQKLQSVIIDCTYTDIVSLTFTATKNANTVLTNVSGVDWTKLKKGLDVTGTGVTGKIVDFNQLDATITLNTATIGTGAVTITYYLRPFIVLNSNKIITTDFVYPDYTQQVWNKDSVSQYYSGKTLLSYTQNANLNKIGAVNMTFGDSYFINKSSAIGVLNNDVVADNSVETTLLGGLASVFTDLSIGLPYYINDNGGLTTIQNNYQIGMALSPTDLLLKNKYD
jgi:hypothetical protein